MYIGPVESEFFGEPAWDMLLVLYCAQQDGETLGSTILSERARVPLTTGLRYLRNLVSTGMAERGKSDADRRIQVVRLSRRAEQSLEAYFRLLLGGSNGSFSIRPSNQPN